MFVLTSFLWAIAGCPLEAAPEIPLESPLSIVATMQASSGKKERNRRMPEAINPTTVQRKLRPAIQGEGWLIAAPPHQLNDLLPKKAQLPKFQNRPNDHTIFRTDDGMWHLWACVMDTYVGYLLCHWTSKDLHASPWRFTGEIFRCDRDSGESLVVWQNQDFIQSPFVVCDGNKWFMFYGGYATGLDRNGTPTIEYVKMENQISLRLSDDGWKWRRYDNGLEQSRVAVGPGAARDVFVAKFNGNWHMYYAGHHGESLDNESIYLRTSRDLISWSNWKLVHHINKEHLTRFTCESPTVVERGGYYYLFRSGGYAGDGKGSVAVFRSGNPEDFGTNGAPGERYVCNINFHAPEIFFDERGNEYISKIFDPLRGNGIFIERLQWIGD